MRGLRTLGRLIEANHFANLDLLTLRKLLTAIIRNDRFCEGALLSALESGTIQKIIRPMQDAEARGG